MNGEVNAGVSTLTSLARQGWAGVAPQTDELRRVIRELLAIAKELERMSITKQTTTVRVAKIMWRTMGNPLDVKHSSRGRIAFGLSGRVRRDCGLH